MTSLCVQSKQTLSVSYSLSLKSIVIVFHPHFCLSWAKSCYGCMLVALRRQMLLRACWEKLRRWSSPYIPIYLPIHAAVCDGYHSTNMMKRFSHHLSPLHFYERSSNSSAAIFAMWSGRISIFVFLLVVAVVIIPSSMKLSSSDCCDAGGCSCFCCWRWS